MDLKEVLNQGSNCELTEKSSLAPDVKLFKDLKFITWNVDGLSEKKLIFRTVSACEILLKEQADVVFLQEVTPMTEEYFSWKLTNYKCLFGREEDDDAYFTGILLKKDSIKLESHNIIEFPKTKMMRNILKVNAQFGDISLCLMNVHLESQKKGSKERKNQLQLSFKEIYAVADNRCVIYGGDMNLRDEELLEIGGLPPDIHDVWVMMGSDKSFSYTWDNMINDNLEFGINLKPRFRFDRVFFRDSSPSKLVPKHFDFIGLERLSPYQCFPSDHWGILCHFGIDCENSTNSAILVTAIDVKEALNQKSDLSDLAEKKFHVSNVKSSKQLNFITWNIDGLNKTHLNIRNEAIHEIILKEEADIVFLQEVVPESVEYFLTKLTNYECIFSGDTGNFTGILLQKSSIKMENHNIIEFPNTQKKRNILKVNVQFGSVCLCLMNVHLEGTAQYKEERKNQLRLSFDEISAIPDNQSVIYAGDMNLQNNELLEIGELPSCVQDIWETLGSNESCCYTFDREFNDNVTYSSKFKPKFRYDRVFLRESSPSKMIPKLFDLIGRKRLLPHRCFPSDHWGILCHFEIK